MAPSKSMADTNVNDQAGRLPCEGRAEDLTQFPSLGRDGEFTRFQTKLLKGKVKLCASCGGVMTRSSRMMLSPGSGLLVVVMGALLMTSYGLATNFFQPPWFIRFALPAAYYVGSIFVSVGILFFFVRERVWYCGKCKEMDKR
jgi:hypothetical protein